MLHLQLDRAATVGVMEDIYQMGSLVHQMVKDAVGAYVQVDLDTAAKVIRRDDQAGRRLQTASAARSQTTLPPILRRPPPPWTCS